MFGASASHTTYDSYDICDQSAEGNGRCISISLQLASLHHRLESDLSCLCGKTFSSSAAVLQEILGQCLLAVILMPSLASGLVSRPWVGA